MLFNAVCAKHPRDTKPTEKIGRHNPKHRHQASVLVDSRPAVKRLLNARMNACKHVGAAGGRFYFGDIGGAKVGRQVLAVAMARINEVNST